MGLRVEVTNADIAAARRLWEGAVSGDAPADRVQALRATATCGSSAPRRSRWPTTSVERGARPERLGRLHA